MTERTLHCGLCGHAFVHGGEVCGSCPVAAGCDLVRCPRCGYQFPRTSRLVDWLTRLWRGQPDGGAEDGLDRAPAGHPLVVRAVDLEPARRLRLAHLGLVKGATVVVEQRTPAVVVTVGGTTVALDAEVAREVHVEPAAEPCVAARLREPA